MKRLALLVAGLLCLATVPAWAQSDIPPRDRSIQRFMCGGPFGATTCVRVHYDASATTANANLYVLNNIIAAGGYKSVLTYSHGEYAVTAAYSNTATPVAGTPTRVSGSGNPYAPVPTVGSIIGVSIAASTALTGTGSAHAEATIYNGTTKIRTGLTTVIGATLAQTQFNTATRARGVSPVAVGRGVGCDTSTAGFGQTNIQLTCFVIFEH